MDKKDEYELWKQQMEFYLDISWTTHKEELDKKLKEKDIIIGSLISQLENKDIEIMTLDDICSLFKWEEQKGRKFLKMALQMKYATKIGKQTIITKSELIKYLDFLKGKELTI